MQAWQNSENCPNTRGIGTRGNAGHLHHIRDKANMDAKPMVQLGTQDARAGIPDLQESACQRTHMAGRWATNQDSQTKDGSSKTTNLLKAVSNTRHSVLRQNIQLKRQAEMSQNQTIVGPAGYPTGSAGHNKPGPVESQPSGPKNNRSQEDLRTNPGTA